MNKYAAKPRQHLVASDLTMPGNHTIGYDFWICLFLSAGIIFVILLYIVKNIFPPLQHLVASDLTMPGNHTIGYELISYQDYMRYTDTSMAN